MRWFLYRLQQLQQYFLSSRSSRPEQAVWYVWCCRAFAPGVLLRALTLSATTVISAAGAFLCILAVSFSNPTLPRTNSTVLSFRFSSLRKTGKRWFSCAFTVSCNRSCFYIFQLLHCLIAILFIQFPSVHRVGHSFKCVHFIILNWFFESGPLFSSRGERIAKGAKMMQRPQSAHPTIGTM